MEVYKITCPDGKFYVGKSVKLMRRFREHWSGRLKSPLGSFDAHLTKFDKKDIIIEVIETCKDEKELYEKENYHIVNNKWDLITGKLNENCMNLIVPFSVIYKYPPKDTSYYSIYENPESKECQEAGEAFYHVAIEIEKKCPRSNKIGYRYLFIDLYKCPKCNYWIDPREGGFNHYNNNCSKKNLTDALSMLRALRAAPSGGLS